MSGQGIIHLGPKLPGVPFVQREGSRYVAYDAAGNPAGTFTTEAAALAMTRIIYFGTSN